VDAQLRVTFSPAANDVYQVRLNLDEPLADATGVAARIKISGWHDLRYVAVGHYGANGFTHIKVRHVQEDEWMTLGFDHRDLAYLVQNSLRIPEPRAIANIMVYIKGIPALEGATLKVEWAAAFAAGEPEHTTDDPTRDPKSRRAVAALREYAAGVNPDWRLEAEAFLTDGAVHVLPQVRRAWTEDGPPPVGMDDNPTIRYSWHALAPVRSLLLLASDGRTDASAAARRLIHYWMDASFHKPDPDQRYVWYDHGVAERTLVLALAQSVFSQTEGKGAGDAWLEDLVTSHAQLLASESFYAANQNSRFHNHALFQDLVLLGVSLISRSTAAATWRDVALFRLRDQLEALVQVEGEFAVLVENSTGYHRGATSLVRLAARLQAASGSVEGLDFTALVRGMETFSALVTYRNGSTPAQGDTFLLPPDTSTRAKRYRRRRGLTLLPRSGYAAVHGRGYSLLLFATGLSPTHKHCDNLSFTLFSRGVEWFIDPSFYSHEYDAPIPAYLRGPWAHNALVIADLDYRIDPGLVRMQGSSERSEFMLEGSHHGFDDHVVRRSVRGTTRRLDVHFEDSWGSLQPCPEATTAFVVLHLGEGVAATPGDEPGSYFLTHPGTSESLIVKYPTAGVRVVQGWNGTPSSSSVAGVGFQTHVDTTSLLLPAPAAGSVSWSISVRGGRLRRRVMRLRARLDARYATRRRRTAGSL